MVGFPWVFDSYPIIKSMDVNFLKKEKEKKKKGVYGCQKGINFNFKIELHVS